MTTYTVSLLNRLNGDTIDCEIEADCAETAQHLALAQVFRQKGWRSSVAAVAREVPGYDDTVREYYDESGF